jgi:hypothetical protein
MEAAMAQTYFARDVFARLGLGALAVTELSCRQTTCRLAYEYPSHLEDLVAASGLPRSSPMVLVEEALGWAAPRGGGLERFAVDRDGRSYTSVSVVLGFDEASWDPAQYGQWVRAQLPSAQAFYRGARKARGQAAEASRTRAAQSFVDAG